MRIATLGLTPLICAALFIGERQADAITLPDTASNCTTSNGGSGCFKITNNHTTGQFAVSGVATGTAIGVSGTSTNGNAISGTCSGSSATAVSGVASGTGTSARGVFGSSVNGTGVKGSASGTNGVGVSGAATGTGAGLTGAMGVSGSSPSGVGVFGSNTGSSSGVTGAGVYGKSSTGYGVYAETTKDSSSAAAVFARTATFGAQAIHGVQAGNDSGTAVLGEVTDSVGNLVGNGFAIQGLGGGIGVWGRGLNVGVEGRPLGTTGVTGAQGILPVGTDSTSIGVIGDATNGSGVGVKGSADSNIGIYGVSNSGDGIFGQSTSNAGVSAYSAQWNAILALTQGTDPSVAAVHAIPLNTSSFAFYGEGGIHLDGATAEKAGGGSWTATSDRRVKKDVSDYDRGLSQLMRLRPVRFKYNGLGGTDDNGKEFVGVIAQDLEQIAPGMVGSRKAKLHKGDAENTDIKVVDPSEFTYMLVNAVKQQQRTIEKQDARIAELERARGPVASSMLSGGIGGWLALGLLPIGMFFARRRSNASGRR